MHEPDGLPGRDAPATVIHRSLPDVPRIDMASHHHDLLGMLPADDLPDHVARNDVRQRGRAHLEQHLDALAPLLQPPQHVGVLDSDRRVWDYRHTGVVAHLSGVRRAERERRNRADQTSHRTRARRGHRAHHPVGHGLAVAGERRVEQHHPTLRLLFPRLQFFEAAHHQDLGADTLRPGANAPAQPEHRQLGPARRHQFQRLLPPHPARDQHRLAPHVL